MPEQEEDQKTLPGRILDNIKKLVFWETGYEKSERPMYSESETLSNALQRIKAI